MGSTRQRPARLAEKLRQIRLALGLSQSEIVKQLGIEDQVDAARISGFETGLREPTLMIVLQYARAANVWTDVLIDDELDLPENLPSRKKHEGVRRESAPRGKAKK
jgi:transcriptional regulator with XRE-family HTH domain